MRNAKDPSSSDFCDESEMASEFSAQTTLDYKSNGDTDSEEAVTKLNLREF